MSPYTTVGQLILTFSAEIARRFEERAATPPKPLSSSWILTSACVIFSENPNRGDMPFALLLLTTFVREVIAPRPETRLRRAVVRTYDYGPCTRSNEQHKNLVENMPEFFYLLINYPALIAAPIIFFAGLALWSHSRTAWVATAAWVVYLGYELGMNAGIFCSGDGCMKRSPLYFGYPLLAFLSAVALVQVYVHFRDNSMKARSGLSIHQPRTQAAGSGSDQVSTVALAWDGFIRALAETSEVHRSGARAGIVADLLRHARELLDIIEDEIANGSSATVGDARTVLAQLRKRLESLEQDVVPTRH